MTGELWPLDPAAYARHALHRTDLAWPESNCYVDLWIELLHTSGAEPLAALPFTFAVDLEGDQWTFFKFPLADLYTLYGVEVFELNVWDRLVAHIEEQFEVVSFGFLLKVFGDNYSIEQAREAGCDVDRAVHAAAVGVEFAGRFVQTVKDVSFYEALLRKVID